MATLQELNRRQQELDERDAALLARKREVDEPILEDLAVVRAARNQLAWEWGDELVRRFGIPSRRGARTARADQLRQVKEEEGLSPSLKTLRRWRETSARWPHATRNARVAWRSHYELNTHPRRRDKIRDGMTTTEARLVMRQYVEQRTARVQSEVEARRAEAPVGIERPVVVNQIVRDWRRSAARLVGDVERIVERAGQLDEEYRSMCDLDDYASALEMAAQVVRSQRESIDTELQRLLNAATEE